MLIRLGFEQMGEVESVRPDGEMKIVILGVGEGLGELVLAISFWAVVCNGSDWEKLLLAIVLEICLVKAEILL